MDITTSEASELASRQRVVGSSPTVSTNYQGIIESTYERFKKNRLMKPKEFVDKYNLSSGWKSQYQKRFLSDLTSEFMAFLEYNKAQDNIKGFDQAVRVISDKWNAISNKTPYGLPEGLWKYFYATVIAPAREQLCPREMNRRREVAAERKRQYEEREILSEALLMHKELQELIKLAEEGLR